VAAAVTEARAGMAVAIGDRAVKVATAIADPAAKDAVIVAIVDRGASHAKAATATAARRPSSLRRS
jgi:hypothetical protein